VKEGRLLELVEGAVELGADLHPGLARRHERAELLRRLRCSKL
jgi:hypothetical protein